MDGARRLEDDLLVPSSLLANPKFCLRDWYTTHLTKQFAMSKDLVRLMHSREPMGDPRRFTCGRVSFRDDISFEIHDKDLNLRLWANDVYQELEALMREKELDGEFNQLRILENEPLSLLDCALEEVAHQLFAMPDIKFSCHTKKLGHNVRLQTTDPEANGDSCPHKWTTGSCAGRHRVLGGLYVIQLAVQGSRSKVNFGTSVSFAEL